MVQQNQNQVNAVLTKSNLSDVNELNIIAATSCMTAEEFPATFGQITPEEHSNSKPIMLGVIIILMFIILYLTIKNHKNNRKEDDFKDESKDE